jgi:peptidoglycan-associated lipoprotein
MRMRLWMAVALAAVISLTVVGCGGKKKGTGDPYDTTGGIGEEGLGGEGSLAEYQRGRLGEGTGGPLQDVTFDYDSYELRDDARITLRENATWLQANTGASVEIEGHCDERGTTEYNLALGAKRAAAARDYLLSLGVAAGRISSTSFGEELPACREVSEDCYQKNRRDRFVTLSPRPAN